MLASRPAGKQPATALDSAPVNGRACKAAMAPASGGIQPTEIPGAMGLAADPDFPMSDFKRLLVRFVRGAFSAKELREFGENIGVQIGDGDGCSSYRHVVYFALIEATGHKTSVIGKDADDEE